MRAVQHLQALVDAPEPPQPPPEALRPVTLGKFEFTPSGVKVLGKPEIEEWAAALHVVSVLERGLAFCVGDLILYGEDAYGEAAAQYIDARHWAPETVRNYVWISKQVPVRNRMIDRGLSMAHHQLVAALEAPEQRRWLKRAASEDAEPWTVARLRAAIREGGDTAPTAWFAVVRCSSEDARDSLVKRLESEGFACKATERR